MIVVPIVIEAYHRAATAEASSLWKLIDKVWELQPEYPTTMQRPDVVGVSRLIKRAWYQRREYFERQRLPMETPACIDALESTVRSLAGNAQDFGLDLNSPVAFDFDLIDWSVWDTELFQNAPGGL